MKNKILKNLETAWAGRTCLCFDLLDSTNEYAKQLAKEGGVHGTLIVADTQTAGKGRRGRIWNSECGTTISMSLCLEPQLPVQKISGLTLVAALAASEAVQKVSKQQPLIKWPNDLVLNGRKICGILTEMVFRESRPVVIVGIGINVNNKHFPEELKDIAGSLKLETGEEISREALIAEVLNCFENYYEAYLQTEDLEPLKENYEAVLANKGKEVRVLDPQAPFTGIAEGITKEGNLIVRTGNGEKKEIYSGEVSVRGLYGYI